jgi:hypothetical protein
MLVLMTDFTILELFVKMLKFDGGDRILLLFTVCCWWNVVPSVKVLLR